MSVFEMQSFAEERGEFTLTPSEMKVLNEVQAAYPESGDFLQELARRGLMVMSIDVLFDLDKAVGALQAVSCGWGDPKKAANRVLPEKMRCKG